MIFHVFTKEGGVGKSELFTNLFDTEICLSQVVTNILQHMFRNPLVGGLAAVLPEFFLQTAVRYLGEMQSSLA